MYTCNLAGQCEEDDMGQFNTLEECQRNCRLLAEGAADAREIAYEIMTFDLEQALEAAPSDRVQVIRRVTGVTVEPASSHGILFAIVLQDWTWLYNSPYDFTPYLGTFLDDLDFLILEMSGIIHDEVVINESFRTIRTQFNLSFRRTFRGLYDTQTYRVLRDNPPRDLQSLEAAVQLELGRMIMYYLVGNDEFYNLPGIAEVMEENWPVVLERFGPEIPYQELIQP